MTEFKAISLWMSHSRYLFQIISKTDVGKGPLFGPKTYPRCGQKAHFSHDQGGRGIPKYLVLICQKSLVFSYGQLQVMYLTSPSWLKKDETLYPDRGWSAGNSLPSINLHKNLFSLDVGRDAHYS